MEYEGLGYCAHETALDHILSQLNPADILHFVYLFFVLLLMYLLDSGKYFSLLHIHALCPVLYLLISAVPHFLHCMGTC